MRVLAIALAGLVGVGGALVAAVAVVGLPSSSSHEQVTDAVDVPPTTTGATATTTTRRVASTTSSTISTTSTAPTTTLPSTTTLAGYAGPEGAPPPDPALCPATVHGAVVDRDLQRGWLCEGQRIVLVFPVTTANHQPDPGTYPVYDKDEVSWSEFGDRPSTLDRFVSFTEGETTGARIAFHAIPRYRDDTLAQPVESVGDLARKGESAGCIRVRPDDAVAIWDWLQIGDEVRIAT